MTTEAGFLKTFPDRHEEVQNHLNKLSAQGSQQITSSAPHNENRAAPRHTGQENDLEKKQKDSRTHEKEKDMRQRKMD